MRLVRLKARSFGCVQSAAIEFGPGLNVLFGPNDLGKSSLAEAIRFALLLQHGSTHSEAFVPWREDASPEVELVFTTEPDKFWRIRKSFGKGTRGSSTFDFSKDGVSFSTDAKGREVDGEIRKHLRWGIPEPGGKSAPRGMPESFLTTVLLARQDGVTELFGRHLGTDQTDGGKKLLTEALQAVAQDPLFLTVLERAQDKVEEAFTPTGAYKRGKGAPFARMKDQIRQAEDDYQSSVRLVAESESARDRLREISEQLVFEEDERTRAGEALAQIDAILAVDARVQTARLDVERIQLLRTKVTETQAERDELAHALVRAEAELRERYGEFRDIESSIARIRREIESLESGESAHQRTVRQGVLEKQIADLDVQREKLTNQQQRAVAVRDLDHRLAALGGEAASLAAQVTKIEAGIAASDTAVEEAQDNLKSLKGTRLWMSRQELVGRIERIRDAGRRHQELETRAEELERRAQFLRAELEGDALPDRREMDRARELERATQIAEAALDVGLAVEVRARAACQLVQAVSPDKMLQLAAGETWILEGGKEIGFSVPGLVEVVVRGGRQEARAAADRARDVYESLVAPWLSSSGASSLTELEARVQAGADKRHGLARLEAEAESVRGQARVVDTGGADLATLEARRVDCERQLDEFPRDVLEERARGLGPAQLTAVETQIAACERTVDQARTRSAQLEADLASRRASAAAAANTAAQVERARDHALTELGQPWFALLEASERQLAEIQSRRDQARAELQTLGAGEEDRLRVARTQLGQATDAAAAVVERRSETEGRVASFRQQAAERAGEVKVRQETFDREDLPGAVQTLERLIRERDALPRPPGMPTPTLVSREAATRRAMDVDVSVRALRAELHAAEGALGQVGGDVARERCQASQASLEKYRAHERGLELEYKAWRLLVETLKEAERDQASHLGETMVDPIAQRFGELAGARYGALDLGPSLETAGIQAAGESRDLARLSVGTREQLSTIFRLSLAEQLRSAILLDDQLTQTDPQRMTWFKQRLRELAQNIQIIVLTCRPDDYLLDGERPDGQPYYELGALRAHDLERLVQRAT